MLLLTLLAPALLQTTPVKPLPRANPSPPPVTEETQVLAPVQALFDALAKRDGAAILARGLPNATTWASVERPDGTRVTRQRPFAEFANAVSGAGPRLEERFVGTPAVEIDGDMAMVWGDYVFLLDGKLSHCGVDHVSLLRDNGQWKIAHMAWTQRTTGCPAQ
jgi:ketosteroid isomerase-like protein